MDKDDSYKEEVYTTKIAKLKQAAIPDLDTLLHKDNQFGYNIEIIEYITYLFNEKRKKKQVRKELLHDLITIAVGTILVGLVFRAILF